MKPIGKVRASSPRSALASRPAVNQRIEVQSFADLLPVRRQVSASLPEPGDETADKTGRIFAAGPVGIVRTSTHRLSTYSFCVTKSAGKIQRFVLQQQIEARDKAAKQ
jgi:hypothetical protein